MNTAVATQTTSRVSITIDGKEVQVPSDISVLQACQRAKTRVPYYCYHPGLSIAGNCRICMVKIEGMPKLQISCNTMVREGMVVNTTGSQVQQAQKEVLEFLLINHPLDCPVCDQAGECELQNYYLEFGVYNPMFNESKEKKKKMQPIGKNIMLDAERCILCSRCVRFTDEITKTGELGIFNRGDRSEISIAPGTTLDNNNYAGNVADICPVGALTDRDFRFQCRVWYLGTQDSICTGCSRGCNIQVHYNKEREWRSHKAHGARVMRLRPRYNPHVNDWWMCDEGRYGFHHVDQQRLMRPTSREHGQPRDIDWDAVIGLVTARLQSAINAGTPQSVGVLVSTQLTNEDLFMVKRLFQDRLDVQVTADLPTIDGTQDDLLMQADKSPNTAGALAMGLMHDVRGEDMLRQAVQGQMRLLWIIDHDLVARFGEEARTALQQVACIVYQGSNANATSALAHIVLPSTAFVERDGTVTNLTQRVQRLRTVVPPLGQSRDVWQVLHDVDRACATDPVEDYATAEDVFHALTAYNAQFAGLTYAQIGGQGRVLQGQEAAS
jgi:NADH-quinone oxidoreductase subunit G